MTETTDTTETTTEAPPQFGDWVVRPGFYSDLPVIYTGRDSCGDIHLYDPHKQKAIDTGDSMPNMMIVARVDHPPQVPVRPGMWVQRERGGTDKAYVIAMKNGRIIFVDERDGFGWNPFESNFDHGRYIPCTPPDNAVELLEGLETVTA